jgi:hypothetical protein
LPHFDFIDPAAPSYAAEVRQLGQRIATVLLYLNEDYEGGGTVFPELGIDHRGKQGDACCSSASTKRAIRTGAPFTPASLR